MNQLHCYSVLDLTPMPMHFSLRPFSFPLYFYFTPFPGAAEQVFLAQHKPGPKNDAGLGRLRGYETGRGSLKAISH